MTYQQHYIENPLKINQMNMQSSEMLHNNRPTSDPSFNLGGKPVLYQQNAPYVKSMLYDRENTYSEIPKKIMTSKSLYINNNFQSSEAEAIDKIFENLSYYEKTLEEMANAKLDDDFKEEMAAIEQWFTVLSECERTTVLYSLIQNISELQVRFFLTLLQQKVKNNSLYNSYIKRPISDSVYSSSTKHCSNDSSENSSLINSTSADTYYDEEDYQKNSFGETNPSNQFACPLNMNEYNMAMNSLSNVNLLNERTSSLSRPINKNHTSATPQPTPSTTVSSPATSRKNSYMNTMMNDYSSIQNKSSNFSVLLNTMAGSSPNSQSMMNSQFLGNTQANLMVNNKSLYSTESQRIPSFTNNTLLNQSTINSLMNPSPFNKKNSTTSALPVLTPSHMSGNSGQQTSPKVSPIRPPKSTPTSNITVPTPIDAQKPTMESQNEREGEKEKEGSSKRKERVNSLHEILLSTKEGSKNASILSNILSLSKEMNDMVNKNKERKKEKQVKSPVTVTSPSKAKKTLSDDGESTILASRSAESVAGSTITTPNREKGKIPDQIDLEMLEDIPLFLRSLRLHKYAPAFEGLNWKQMIKIENDELLRRGVTALGARNKMLKVFDLIRAEAIKQGISLDC